MYAIIATALLLTLCAVFSPLWCILYPRRFCPLCASLRRYFAIGLFFYLLPVVGVIFAAAMYAHVCPYICPYIRARFVLVFVALLV